MSDIECGICFLRYNEEERTPRILTSCGHTVCHQCALELLRDDRMITCPFDRKVTQLNRNEGVNGLPKNFALLEITRKVDQEQEKNSGKEADVPCFEDSSHEAVVYCQQCEVDFCDKCFTFAYRPKALSAHQKSIFLEDQSNFRNAPNTLTTLPNSFAWYEPNCKNPTKIMCQTCALFDQHKTHKYDFLMEKLLKNEQEKHGLKNLEVFRKSSEALIGVANLSLGSYEVTGEAFKNVAKSISDQFDMKKKEALCKLTQFANKRKEEQIELKRKMGEKFDKAEEIKELIEEKLKRKNDLQNTDEITKWKKTVGSGEPSSSDFCALEDHEFIISDMHLQMNPKRNVPEPSNSVQSVTNRNEIITRNEKVIRILRTRLGEDF